MNYYALRMLKSLVEGESRFEIQNQFGVKEDLIVKKIH